MASEKATRDRLTTYGLSERVVNDLILIGRDYQKVTGETEAVAFDVILTTARETLADGLEARVKDTIMYGGDLNR